MVKKLGNFWVLVGLVCLVLFFSSSHFLVDQAWFLIGGLGFTSLGLLLKRRSRRKRRRRKKSKREQEGEADESD